MTRYQTRSVGWCEDDIDPDTRTFEPTLDVDDRKEVDTGLVTSVGDRIYRIPPPVGFGRDAEW